MTLILDGKSARDSYKSALIGRVGAAKGALGVSPRLAIIQIGDNRESSIYIEQKKKFAAAIGASVDHIKFSDDAAMGDIVSKIDALNADKNIHGIIVQLPVPAHLDKLALINAIDPKKDVDGLCDDNQRLIEMAAQGKGKPGFIPATAKGVMLLLDFYHIDPRGKSAAVFGRSRLVGHPIAELLKIRGANVVVIHSKTENPAEKSRSADIVVVAIGNPKHIGPSYIKEGAIVVDVGINSVAGDKFEEELPKRKIIGDVDFDAVKGLVSAISPVPGGVGPMTVLALFDNLVVSAENALTSQ